MIENIKIIKSDIFNPEFNLAVENRLFQTVKDGEMIMFLWQNDNTVVIGKNQNMYRECNLENIKKGKGRIVRRNTGGGAVYHDKGNLNYSYISKKADYDKETVFNIIVKALANLGITAEISGRNDILVNGKKFSGNAFLFKDDRVLHHGTIMLTVNEEKLHSYLKIPIKGASAVSSVPSRVINLKAVAPDLTLEKLEEAIINTVCDTFLGEKTILDLSDISLKGIEEESKAYTAFDEVILSNTAKEQKFSWGTVILHSENGKHKGAVIFSDGLVPEVIDYVNTLLAQGVEIVENPHFDCIKNAMVKDISQFLRGNYEL